MNCIVLCCCHYGVMKRNSIITSTPLIARKEKVLFEIGQMPGEGRGGGKCRLTTPQKGVAIRRRNRATPASFLRTTRHGSTVTDQAAKITTCYTTGSQRTHRCCLLASNAEHVDHVNCRTPKYYVLKNCPLPVLVDRDTKLDFRCGSSPNPAGEAYSTHPDP